MGLTIATSVVGISAPKHYGPAVQPGSISTSVGSEESCPSRRDTRTRTPPWFPENRKRTSPRERVISHCICRTASGHGRRRSRSTKSILFGCNSSAAKHTSQRSGSATSWAPSEHPDSWAAAAARALSSTARGSTGSSRQPVASWDRPPPTDSRREAQNVQSAFAPELASRVPRVQGEESQGKIGGPSFVRFPENA